LAIDQALFQSFPFADPAAEGRTYQLAARALPAIAKAPKRTNAGHGVLRKAFWRLALRRERWAAIEARNRLRRDFESRCSIIFVCSSASFTGDLHKAQSCKNYANKPAAAEIANHDQAYST
jgi:hypothetical protein